MVVRFVKIVDMVFVVQENSIDRREIGKVQSWFNGCFEDKEIYIEFKWGMREEGVGDECDRVVIVFKMNEGSCSVDVGEVQRG